MATFSHRFDADHRSLSDIRSEYRAWLESDERGRVAPESAIDADVVATELAANVIDHTDSPWVWLEITVTDTSLTVEVSHIGPATAVPESPAPVLDPGQVQEVEGLLASLSRDAT